MGLETPPTATEIVSSEPRTRYGLSLCGLALAVAGLMLAVAWPYIGEILEPPPPPEPRLKLSEILSEAGERFVDRMLDRARGKAPAPRAEPPPKPRPSGRPWLLYLSIVATSLGLVGSLSGTVGWIRREDSRLSGSAIAVGAIAVGWIYIVAAVVTALVILILWLLSSALNWSP